MIIRQYRSIHLDRIDAIIRKRSICKIINI